MTPFGILQSYKADKEYEEIHALFLRDNYIEAEEKSVELLKKYPEHIKTLLLVAQIARHEEHFQKSWEWYNKVLHVQKNHKEWLLGRARSSYQLYNFEDALEDYLTLYETSFNNTEYLISLWDVYQKINLQKIALRYFQKAVKQAPKNIHAHIWVGYQYIILGQYGNAKEHITIAKEIYYDNKKLHEESVLENIEGLEEQLGQLTLETPKPKRRTTKKKVTRRRSPKK